MAKRKAPAKKAAPSVPKPAPKPAAKSAANSTQQLLPYKTPQTAAGAVPSTGPNPPPVVPPNNAAQNRQPPGLPNGIEDNEAEEEEHAAVDDRDASPTTSEGPEFEMDPTIAEEDWRAARGNGSRPLGFTNPGPNKFRCYANSVVVVLLHSDRIMQWIRNRYIRALDEAGVARRIFDKWRRHPKTSERMDINPVAKLLKELRYTDVLCELSHLSHEFSFPKSQNDLDVSMQNFWDYLQNEHRRYKVNGPVWEFNGQQDAAGLLRWLVEMARLQRQTLVDGGLAPMLPSAEMIKLEPLRDLDIDNIIGFQKTSRVNCAYCNRAGQTKKRRAAVENDNIFSFSVVKSVVGGKKNKYEAEVDMYECLRQSLKSDSDVTCAACEVKLKPIHDAFTLEKAKINGDARYNDRQKELALQGARDHRDQMLEYAKSYNGYCWQKIGRLPEVLFLSLTRVVSYEEQTKQRVIVHIPPTLDFRDVVEHRVPLPKETKYRIVGIVNHVGKMDSGHYVAQTFTEEKGWTEYNDDNVNPTNLKAIIDHQRKGPVRGFTPYVLMYEKIPYYDCGGLAAAPALQNHNPSGDDGEEGRNNDVDVGAPTLYRRPTLVGPGNPGVRLEVATSHIPEPDRGYLTVTAEINDHIIAFPSYVINDHSNTDVRFSKLKMYLRDTQNTLRLEARQGCLLPGVSEGSSKRSSRELERSGSEHDDSASASKRRKTNPPSPTGKSGASTRRATTSKLNGHSAGGQRAPPLTPKKLGTIPAANKGLPQNAGANIRPQTLPVAPAGARYQSLLTTDGATTGELQDDNRHSPPGLWAGAGDSDDDMDPFATTWGQAHLSARVPRFPPSSTRPRYLDMDFNGRGVDRVQALLDRRRRRRSFGSHGDADNELTVSSPTSGFTNAASGYSRYWGDDGVSVGPRQRVYMIEDSDDEDEEQEDVVHHDRYQGSKYGYVLGMGGKAAAALAKRWAHYV